MNKKSITLNPSNINNLVSSIKKSIKNSQKQKHPEGIFMPAPPVATIKGWWWKKYFNKYQMEKAQKQLEINENWKDIINEVLRDYSPTKQ